MTPLLHRIAHTWIRFPLFALLAIYLLPGAYAQPVSESVRYPNTPADVGESLLQIAVESDAQASEWKIQTTQAHANAEPTANKQTCGEMSLQYLSRHSANSPTWGARA